MPKKKRFRNGRGRKKRNHIKTSTRKTISKSEDQMECLIMEISSTQSLADILTPIRNIEGSSPRSETVEVPLNNQLPAQVPLITETPVNRRRSLQRDRNYASMNITNLNVLFDSNFINNSPQTECNISISRNERSKFSISNSSVSKPQCFTQGTQTELGICEKQVDSITETPRYNRIFLTENTYAYKSFPFIKNHDSLNNIESCSDKPNRYDSTVNVNPYLKHKDIEVRNHGNSFGEMSFFSPKLYYQQTSSTPIDKILNNAFEVDLPNGFVDNSFGTPRLNLNRNVNDGISPEKVRNITDFI